MPHDLKTVGTSVIEKTGFGRHDLIVQAKYEAPSTPEGGVADDPFARMDMANAKWMLEVLQKHYPGHGWRTVYDGAQKMAYFSLPVLMGINKFWAINLTTDALDEGLMMRAGGQLLERYGLSRSRFQLAPFLEAREKHSALVDRRRVIPH